MKIGLVNLGCPKNLVDGEVMLGIAQQAGHEITSDSSAADVVVVNTCAFIDKAKQESIDTILEMAQLKNGRVSRLVVTGCLAERYRDELKNEIPEIDALLGTGEVDQILSALDSRSSGRPGSGSPGSGRPVSGRPVPGRPGSGIMPLTFHKSSARSTGLPDDRPTGLPDTGLPDTGLPDTGLPDTGLPDTGLPDTGLPDPGRPDRGLPTYLYDAETPRLVTTPKHFAYVKVAEGCDYTCAFCIIPTLRGKFRSRDAQSIVREARTLVARGVKELLLISQDTTFYGIDKGERGALARLLRELNAVDGLEWIRLLYLYPTTITDDVLAAMAECEKVCRYIDLPLQHASASVLKRMRRPGDRRTYDKLLTRIRQAVPEVTLRTTFIVGFPGETEQEFGELEQFVSDVGFDHVGVFTYSHEEGTRAFAAADDVPAAIKRKRRNALMARQKKIVAQAQKRRIGSEVRVLIDGPSPEHDLVLQGRLEGQAPDIDPMVVLTDCDPSLFAPGDLITARIVGSRDYDLVAQPTNT